MKSDALNVIEWCITLNPFPGYQTYTTCRVSRIFFNLSNYPWFSNWNRKFCCFTDLQRIPEFVSVSGEGGEDAGCGGADVGAQGERVGAVQLDQARAHQGGLKRRTSWISTFWIIDKSSWKKSLYDITVKDPEMQILFSPISNVHFEYPCFSSRLKNKSFFTKAVMSEKPSSLSQHSFLSKSHKMGSIPSRPLEQWG